MATAKKSAAKTAKKRPVSTKTKRGPAKIQDNFFKRNIAAIIIFVILFGAIGAYLIVSSHAATSTVELRVGSTSGPCIAGASTEPCDPSVANRVYYDITGNSGFAIRSTNNLCIDDWNATVQLGPLSRGYPREPIHYVSCYGDANQTWHWGGSDDHELVNNASGGCLNSLGNTAAGAPLGTYVCNSDANEKFFKQYVSTSTGGGGSGGGTTSLSQQFKNRAMAYRGEYYNNNGGGLPHVSGYSAYKSQCEGGVYGGTIKFTSGVNSQCSMDCSAFISVVVDDVLHTGYSWIVGNGNNGAAPGVMSGGGSWNKVSLSSVQPGDIVTISDHVEMVVSGSGSNITTIGEHNSTSYPVLSTVTWPGYWTAAYHWQ